MTRTAFCLALLLLATPAFSAPPSPLQYERPELIDFWRNRIIAFLDQGVIPIIDLQSSMKRKDGELYLAEGLKAMDESGVALMALDGYQATVGAPKGYRWGYYIHELVNEYPDRFILATNGGTNNNWIKGKGGDERHFIDQTETHVRTGTYPIMGEYEFRHYMSSSQCRQGLTHRDVTLPVNSANGHRLFALSQETGIAFLIHLEPEDRPLDELEEMLTAYPEAKVVVCHFGQIRYPDRQQRFSASHARQMLQKYPNLHYDLSVGEPGRRYPCTKMLDTVLWKEGNNGQRDMLKPEFRSLLTEYSHRFVAGFDYGGGRGELGKFIKKRAANIRLIIRDLPDRAKHDIAYRNAWRLLTGTDWN